MFLDVLLATCDWLNGLLAREDWPCEVLSLGL